MVTSVILSATDDNSRDIDQSFIMKAATRISHTIGFKGSFIALPDCRKNSVVLMVDPAPDMSDTDVTRLIRTIAFESLLDITDVDHKPMFLDAPDTDTSFIEYVPAPEDEIGPCMIHFAISNIQVHDIDKVFDVLDNELNRRKYFVCMEIEGTVTAYLTRSNALDLYIDEATNSLHGEIDVSWAGAGVYAEVCELAEAFAAQLGGKLTYEDFNITYQYDHNMDKLRQRYYEVLREELAFAYAELRAGGQAYIGWQICEYEPEWIAGSVITQFGRYNFDRLIDEIEKYGLETIADHYFYIRNYNFRGTADEEVKNALIVINTFVHFSPDERLSINSTYARQAIDHIENAVLNDPNVPIPVNEYNDICNILNNTPMFGNDYISHNPLGYLRGAINTGFGSYIRNFRIDGQLIYRQLERGEYIIFNRIFKQAIQISCRVEYLDTDAELDDNFFADFPAPEYIDIGGSAICRFSTTNGAAKAEIIVHDERYMLKMNTDDDNLIPDFVDSLRGCRCIEELEEQEDQLLCARPSAPGAFFPYGLTDEPASDMTNYNDNVFDIIAQNIENDLCKMLNISIVPSIMITFDKQCRLPTTASRLSGSPYLPAGFEIPKVPLTEGTRKNGSVGQPMTLIAQFNLAEFEADQVELPPFGMLQFYTYISDSIPDLYVSSEQIYFRVVYFPSLPDGIETEQGAVGQKLEFTYLPIPISTKTADFNESTVDCDVSESDKEFIANIYKSVSSVSNSRIGGCVDSKTAQLIGEYGEYTYLLLKLDVSDFCSTDESGTLSFYMKPEAIKNADFSDVLIVWNHCE